MIATSIAHVLATDWSAITSPTKVEEELCRLGIMLKALRRREGEHGSFMQLWLLAGSRKETGERLMLEYTRGPFITEPHGYPQNGAAYGQRVWVLRGELQFICTGTPEPLVVVGPLRAFDHPGGVYHRTFIKDELLALVHQPHGSILHPALQALSARFPRG